MPAAPRRLSPAVADIISAAEWYDDQQPGLGDEFVAEVDAVIAFIRGFFQLSTNSAQLHSGW